MKAKLQFLICVISSTFLTFSVSTTKAQVANDNCETAIQIPAIVADASFIKIQGSTSGALSESIQNGCFINTFPTVWYFVEADSSSTILNLQVTSNDFNTPAISLFHLVSDCSSLEPVALTQNGLDCVFGSNGVALAIGSEITAGEVYYIAITSPYSSGGDFELSINTISIGSKCVSSRNIEITYRSTSGPLTGPFFPGETISVCMNVDTFTAVENGCQWFQGIVPVFGNGWDPSSFDANGQPLNATVNGLPMGQVGNGLYEVSFNQDYATWDWFTDVGHHHDNTFFQISDFDGNGSLDICHTLYEPNCPDVGGISGGCCPACWDNPGDLLPPGWFAYGINGSCAIEGPPIAKDWGDGITCGCCMGPWTFCFDIMIREFPDCSVDSTMKDLSIGFFTFADGQTGSWTGGESVCALDQPVKIILPLCCNATDYVTTFLDPICSGEGIEFSMENEIVQYWLWTADFENVTGAQNGSGGPGSMIVDTLLNTGDTIEYVTYTILGFVDDQCPAFEGYVTIPVYPGIDVIIIPDQTSAICQGDTIVIASEVSGGEAPYTYEWTTPVGPINGESVEITVAGMYSLIVEDNVGCTGISDTLIIEVNTNPVVELGEDTITIDSQVILDAGNPGAAFLWNTGDTTQFIIINASGLYNVLVTDSLGCIAEDSVYINIITSISDRVSQRIHVFPNPSHGFFTITGDLETPILMQIKAVNSLGVVVYSSSRELVNSIFSKTIDMQFASRGIYTLQIYLGEEMIVHKVVVE